MVSYGQGLAVVIGYIIIVLEVIDYMILIIISMPSIPAG